MPLTVQGRYLRYKAGTRKTREFLIATAARCGDLATILPRFNARFLKRLQLFSKNQLSENLRTDELVSMAKAIANSAISVEIPESILRVLREAITLREGYAAWYSAQRGGSELQRANESHRHFIEVGCHLTFHQTDLMSAQALRQVLELLTSARVRSAATVVPSKAGAGSRACQTARARPQDATDLMSDTPADSQLNQTTSPSSDAELEATNDPLVPPNASVKLEKKIADPGFAFWCHLKDMNDVCEEVHNTWLAYKRGEITFYVASTTMSTAGGLLRTADAEFSATTSMKSTDWRDVLKHQGLTFFTRGNTVWLCPEDDIAAATADAAPGGSTKMSIELLHPIAAVCLLTYMQDSANHNEHQESLSGIKKKMPMPTAMHHFNELSERLWDMTPCLRDFAQLTSTDSAILDEFVQTLLEIQAEQRISMSAVYICQMYLNLYDVLGDDIGLGMSELRKAHSRHSKTAEAVASIRPAPLHRTVQNNIARQDVDAAFHWTDWLDENFELLATAWKTGPKPAHGAAVRPVLRPRPGRLPYIVEYAFPTQAGVLLTHITARMHQVGTLHANLPSAFR